MDGDAMRMRAALLMAAVIGLVLGSAVTPGTGGFAPEVFPIPQDAPPVQPAPYAFAIWGLLFAGLLGHAGLGLVARPDDPAWDAPRLPLLLSAVLGAPWLAVAKMNAPVATVEIVAMAGLAVLALLRTPAGDGRGGIAEVLRVWPVAMYAGWLTAAAWVAVGFSMAGFGFTGERTAALVALAGAAACAVLVQGRVPFATGYGLAVVWAVAAVVVANAGGDRVVAAVALAGAVGVGAALVASRRRYAARVAS